MADLKILISGFRHGFTDLQFDKLAKLTKGRSCADIHAMVKKLESKRWPALDTATKFTVHKKDNGENEYEECDGNEGTGGDSISMTFSQIMYSDLRPKKITIKEIKESIYKHKPTMTIQDSALIVAFEKSS